MKKTFKRKMLISALALCFALTGCEKNKTPSEYIASGDSLFQQKQYSTAVVELKNALKLEPKNGQARHLLGRTYSFQGNLLAAEKELEKALELGIEQSLIIPDLVKIKMQLGKSHEVYELVKNSASIIEEAYIKALVYAGIAALNENDKTRAEDYIEQARAMDEQHTYSQLGAAWLAFANEKFRVADKSVDTILDEFPDFTEALLLSGMLHQQLRDFQQAASVFQKLQTLHPELLEYKLLLVNSLISTNDLEQAQEHVTELLKTFPSHANSNYYQAMLHVENKDYEQTKLFAEKALEADSSLIGARLLVGISAYFLEEYEQSYKYLQAFKKDLPKNHPALYYLEHSKTKLGYKEDSTESLLAGVDDLNLKLIQETVKELVEQGDLKKATELLVNAGSLLPDNTDIKIQKGNLLLSQNNISGADELARAIELDPELDQVKVNLVITYMRANQDVKALDIAREMQLVERTAVLGHILEGLVYSKQRKKDKEKAKYQQALLLEPNHISANYYMGLLAAKAKETTLAIESFKKVITQHTEHYSAISRLISINLKNGKFDDSDSFFNELQQRYPKDVNPIIARSVNLYAADHASSAIKLLNGYRKSPITNDKFWLVLAELNKSENKTVESINIYREQLKMAPDNTKFRLALISTFANNGDLLSAIKEAEQGLLAEPTNDQYRLIKVKFLLEDNNTSEAELIIDKLLDENPDNINVLKLAAEIAKLNKDYGKEIEAFSTIYDSTQNGKHLISLALALDKDGRRKEAIKALSSNVNKHRNVYLRVLLAEYQVTESASDALSSYYKLLKESPNNIVLLNNIAWSELTLGNIPNAKIYAKKAVQLAGNNPKILDTYGLVLLTNKEISKAVDILKQAHELAKDDHEIIIHLAQALIENKDQATAKSLITDLQVDDKKLSEQLEQLKTKL